MIQIIMIFEEATENPSIKNGRSFLFMKKLKNIPILDVFGIVDSLDNDSNPLEEAISQDVPFIIDNTPMDIEQNTFTLINVSTGEKNNMSESQIIELIS